MTPVRPSRETIGERSLKHGHTAGRSASPTFRSWATMISRCTNSKLPQYKRYGGRGITVCDRWRSFQNFLEDMGERPSLKYSLDRYPNQNGNYEPGNCRWADARQQRLNRASTRPVIRSDGTLFPSIVEAAEATGGRRSTIRDICNGRGHTHKGYGWRYAE